MFIKGAAGFSGVGTGRERQEGRILEGDRAGK